MKHIIKYNEMHDSSLISETTEKDEIITALEANIRELEQKIERFKQEKIDTDSEKHKKKMANMEIICDDIARANKKIESWKWWFRPFDYDTFDIKGRKPIKRNMGINPYTGFPNDINQYPGQ